MPITPEMKKLLEEKGIVGVSDPANKIRIYVETVEDAEKVLMEVPEIRIAGVSYEVEPIISGRFFALANPTNPRNVVRPLLGGISCGNKYITAGTLGLIVRDAITKELKILSNNHVLTRIMCGVEGEIGDEILQPGPYDGGTDVIGRLEKYVSIKLPPETNLVDVAIASCEVDAIPYEVNEIGKVGEVVEAKEGMRVKKFGRTTELTEAKIIDTSATVKVYGYYSPDSYVIFEKQIVISPAIALGGDSGSVLLTTDNKIVGLVFAGSDRFTLANHFTEIVKLLNIEIPVLPKRMGAELLLLGTLTSLLFSGVKR